MTGPSWVRLVGWMDTVTATTVRGSWLEHDDDRTISGRFACRRPHAAWDWSDWSVVDDTGTPVPDLGPRQLLDDAQWPIPTDDDRTTTPQVSALEHHGRRAWQVRLGSPDDPHGGPVLVVDDETGLPLHLSDPVRRWSIEISKLEVDVPLQEATFDHARQERHRAESADAQHEELLALCRRTPPPTPRWFPWRSVSVEAADCQVLDSPYGSGAVSRAARGETPELTEDLDGHTLHLDSGDHAWAVVTPTAIDHDTALRITTGVIEGRPYEH